MRSLENRTALPRLWDDTARGPGVGQASRRTWVHMSEHMTKLSSKLDWKSDHPYAASGTNAYPGLHSLPVVDLLTAS